MKKIQSFTVNHDLLLPGLYISRQDGDATTFDLRTRKPNAGDDMDNLTHIFYDDKSFDEWVNATLTKFSECDCRDMCIYAVHIN